MFLGAGLLLLSWPAVSPGAALLVILVARSVSDIGAASGGSLLPSSTIAGLLACAAIVTAVMPGHGSLPRGARTWIAAYVVVSLVWAVVAIASGVSVTDATMSLVRWISLLAVGILAYRSAALGGSERFLYVPVVVASVASILGSITQFAPMIQDGGRIAGTFSHANTAGAFFSVALLVVLDSTLRRPRRSAFIMMALSAAGLLLTESVSSLIATGIGAFVMIVVSTRLSSGRKLLLISGGGVIALLAVLASGVTRRFDEFETLDIGAAVQTGVSGNSLEWRFINWHYYLDKLASSPWVGFGLGSNSEYSPLGAPPHSIFIQTLYDFGLLGSAILLTLTVAAMRLVKRQAPRAFPIAFGLLSFALVNGFASNLIGYTAAVYLALAAVGYWVARSFLARDAPASVPRLGGVFA